MKDNLLLDVYLAGHVHNLYSLIRNRSLIQYFRLVTCLTRLLSSETDFPFSSVLQAVILIVVLEVKKATDYPRA